MASNDRDIDPRAGGSTSPDAAETAERQPPRPLGAAQWMQSMDDVRHQVSALLDSWAAAEVDALLRELHTLLDGGGPQCPCASEGCPRA